MSKRTIFITLLVIALIIFGAAALYITTQRQESKVETKKRLATTTSQSITQLKESTTTEPIDTSDWKTYRNEEYGFELKYPPNLIGLERIYSRGGSGINFKLPKQKSADPSEPYAFYARRFLSSGIPDPCLPQCQGVQVNKEIGGVKFIRIQCKNLNSFSKGLIIILYLGKIHNICYHLECDLNEDTVPNIDKAIKQFESIVSTFRLLE